jgi:hypothetical protein
LLKQRRLIPEVEIEEDASPQELIDRIRADPI